MTEQKQNNTETSIVKDDTIDLMQLIIILFKKRRIIYYCVIAFIIIGLIIAYSTPNKYTASITLLPSAKNSNKGMGGLGILAGMAGINIGSMMNNSEEISTDIYPKIVQSYPFAKDLINKKYNYEKFKEPISMRDYILSDTIKSNFSKMKNFIRTKIFHLDNKKKNVNTKNNISTISKDGIISLSDIDASLYESVKNLLQINIDKDNDLITIQVTTKEPLLSAQVVNYGVKLLSQYVINYKTSQSRQNLNFIQEQYNEKLKEYKIAQDKFFKYKDSHRNVISERIDVEFQLLSDEYDLLGTVLKGLAQQLEQAKITVNEQTPAFSIIQPAQVPKVKSSPKRSIIMIVSVILGSVLGISIILFRIVFNNFRNNIKNKKNN